MRRLYPLATALAWPMFAAAAQADPGGTSSVSGPNVTRGAFEYEARAATYFGGALDGGWAHRAQASYGVSNRVRAAFIVTGADAPGDESMLRGVAVEALVALTPARAPVDLAAQVQYRVGLNGADDRIELKAIAGGDVGALNLRINLTAERPTGAGVSDEWAHGYAAHALWRASPRLRVGVEAFGDFDDDAHALGPRVAVRFGDVTVAAAYLAGLGASEADGQVRLSVGYAH